MRFDCSCIIEKLGRGRGLKVKTGLAWSLGDKVFRILAGGLIGILIGRYLGPEKLGQWSYMLVWSAFGTAVTTLGLERILVRELATDPQNAATTLGTALSLRLGVAVGMYAVWAGLTWLTVQPGELRSAAWICGLMLLTQPFLSVDSWFQAHTAPQYSIIAQNTALLLGAGLRLAIIWQKLGLIALASVAVLESMVGCVILWRFFAKSQGRGVATFGTQKAMKLLSEGLPLALGALAAISYMRIDQILITKNLGSAANGVYAAAVRLSELTYIIPTLLCFTLFPTLSQLHREQPERYMRWRRYMLDIGCLIAYASCLVVCLMAPWLCNLTYGPKFAGCAPILRVHVWTCVFVTLLSLRGSFLIIEGRSIQLLKCALIGSAVGVLACGFLCKPYGFYGAAVSAITGYAASAYLSALLIKEFRLWREMTMALLLPITGWRYFRHQPSCTSAVPSQQAA